MYFFIYQILLFLFNTQVYLNIEQKNLYIDEFNKKMQEENYKEAIKVFEKLEAVHRVIDSHLRIDAAHAYYASGDTLNARINYEFTKDIADPLQSSISRNQLGLLALARGDSAAAIQFFKTSIEKNHELDEARYNFELISRLYKPKAGPKSLENPEPSPVEISEKKEEDLESTEGETISKERALIILDNLRVSERKGLISSKKGKQEIEKDW